MLFLGKIGKLSQGLPFLALPNEAKKSPVEEKTEQVDDLMSQLESMAPSAQGTSNTQ